MSAWFIVWRQPNHRKSKIYLPGLPAEQVYGSQEADMGQIWAGIVQLLRKIVVMTRVSVAGAKIYPKDAQKSDLIRKKYGHNSV